MSSTSRACPTPRKWSYDIERNAAGWYNNELQYYGNARPENSTCRGRHAGDHRAARGPVDSGPAGLERPAIFLGAPDHARQGELDLRLHRGARQTTLRRGYLAGDLDAVEPAADQLARRRRDRHHGTRRLRSRRGARHGAHRLYNDTRGNQTSATRNVADACNEFHRYQMRWTANRITVGVDDRNYYQYSNDNSGNAEWPFDSPQYLILNIAVGGDWGGQQGVNDAIFPVRMEVDYVRVYQR